MNNLIRSIGTLAIAGVIALSPCYGQEARFKPMYNYSNINLENTLKSGDTNRTKDFYSLYDTNDLGILNKHEFNCNDTTFVELVNKLHFEVFGIDIPDDTIISVTDKDTFEKRYSKDHLGMCLKTSKYGEKRYFIDIKDNGDYFSSIQTISHEFGHRYCHSPDIVIQEAAAITMQLLWSGHINKTNKQFGKLYGSRKMKGDDSINYIKSYNLVKELLPNYKGKVHELYNYLRKK